MEFEFRDYLAILRRRKLTVILAVAVVLSGALFLSLKQDKVYRSTGVVLIASEDSSTPDLETEVRVLESAEVRALAAKKLPAIGAVSGTPGGSKRIMAVAVESTDPAFAAKSVATYIEAYGDYRQSRAEERLQTSTQQAQTKIDDLQKDIDGVTAELDTRRREVDNRFLPVAGESPVAAQRRQAEATRSKTAVEEQLKPRLNSLISQQIALEQLRRELVVKSQQAGERPTVITAPAPSSVPVKPKPIRDGILAAGAGLVLGIALALAFEYLDDSINTPDDVRRALHDQASVVGVVPNWSEWKDGTRSELVSLAAPKSPVAEAYRSIRTSISFLGVDQPLGSLSVTSPSAGEGKTTTLANLAVVLAGTGKRVIMVDCDLRRPRLHTFFGLQNTYGFTSVLIGDRPISAALQDVPGVERMSLLASGPIPPNPSELLSSSRLSGIVRQLQADGAMVLIDSPPLLPVTDAALIASAMDATLLVASAGRSSRKHLQQAVENLRKSHAPLVGVVLNRVASTDSSYYYYYHHEDEGRRRPNWRRTPEAAGNGRYTGGRAPADRV